MITRNAPANQSPAVGLCRSTGFGVAFAGWVYAGWVYTGWSLASGDIAKPCDAMSLDRHEGTPRMIHLVGGSA